MSVFISWYEYQGKLYYLTDAEVFSSEGKKALDGFQGNDLLGHKAIAKYFFEAEGIDITGGCRHEQINFWNTDNLPKEISDKTKDFDAYWGRMFSSGCFANDNLVYIVCYAANEWKIKASARLLKQHPYNDELVDIICDAPGRLGDRAWKQLLKQNPSDYELVDIICGDNTPDKLKANAWELLLKQDPSDGVLEDIVYDGSDEWKARARAELNKRGYNY